MSPVSKPRKRCELSLSRVRAERRVPVVILASKAYSFIFSTRLLDVKEAAGAFLCFKKI